MTAPWGPQFGDEQEPLRLLLIFATTETSRHHCSNISARDLERHFTPTPLALLALAQFKELHLLLVEDMVDMVLVVLLRRALIWMEVGLNHNANHSETHLHARFLFLGVTGASNSSTNPNPHACTFGRWRHGLHRGNRFRTM